MAVKDGRPSSIAPKVQWTTAGLQWRVLVHDVQPDDRQIIGERATCSQAGDVTGKARQAGAGTGEHVQWTRRAVWA